MKYHATVFGWFVLVTLVVSWPLILKLNSLIIDPHDGLLLAWVINWDIHSLTSGLAGLMNFYHANIFYPFKWTLAFSDLHLPEAIIALPFVLAFKEPLVAYNVNFLLGFFLTAFSVYLLVLGLTHRRHISVFAGTLFSFSSIHLNYMAHLQLFNFWPVVLGIKFLLEEKRFWFVVSVVIASLLSPLNFYFLALCTSLWLVFNRDKFRKVIFSFVIAAVIVAPFLLPYLIVSRQFAYTRPINDAIHFSLYPLDVFNIGSTSQLSNLFPSSANSTPGYFGAAFYVLMMFLVLDFIKKKQQLKQFFKKSKAFIFSLAIALCSYVLALGPGLHIFRNTIHVGPIPIIPLPYLVFYYLIPGFSGFRTPSRWIILSALALVLAISIYFRERLSKKAIFILCLLIFVEVNFPFNYASVPSRSQFPPEQQWLAENRKGVPIIQFPIFNWDDRTSPRVRATSQVRERVDGFGMETLREYYSTIHFHPMFNGFSGFSPKEWENQVKWLQKDFPSKETIAFLRRKQIRLVVADRKWKDLSSWPNSLKLIKRFPETEIYEIQ